MNTEQLIHDLRQLGKYSTLEPNWLLVAADKIEELSGRVEVKHGTWYHGVENGSVYAKCSACGRKMNYSCYGYAYCSLCGARMDGERKESEVDTE